MPTGTDPALIQRLPQTARRILELGAPSPAIARAWRSISPDTAYWLACATDEIARTAEGVADRSFVGDLATDSVLEAIQLALEGELFDAVILPDPETLTRYHVPLAAMMRPGAVWLAPFPNAGRAEVIKELLLGASSVQPAFSQATTATLIHSLGMQLVDVVPIGQTQDADTMLALQATAQTLGADPEAAGATLRTDRWLARFCMTPPAPPLSVVALGLRKLGGVTEARVDYPLQALASLPSVTAAWGSGSVVFPKGIEPGVFLLHRQFLNGAPMIETVERMITRGWTVVSDMDDDPRHWAEYVDSDFRAFRGVHAVTVSTPAMADLIRQWNPEVEIFPNHLPALPAVPPLTPKSAGRLRLFFGALNRTGDWPAILKALSATALRHADQLELVVVHDRAFFDELPEGIIRSFHPTLPHEAYMEVLGTCDLALLPLADTPFNRLKSDLKLIECAGAGVVPICSRVIYGEDPEHHRFAVFADEPADWSAALSALLASPAEVRRRRDAGRDYVTRRRLHSGEVQRRMTWLRDIIARRTDLEQQRQTRLAAHPFAGA